MKEEPIRELVEDKPTMFRSRTFTKLRTDCLYFLFSKDPQNQEVLTLKPLKLAGGKNAWFLVDLFYPWNNSYNTTDMDAQIENEDEYVRKLLKSYHLVEIEHEYWDSSSIPDTNRRFKNAIATLANQIVKTRAV